MGSGESDILSAINRMALGSDGANTPPLGNMAFGGERSSLISDILSGKRLSPDSNPYLASNLDYFRGEANKTLGGNMNLLDAAFGKNGMGIGSGRSAEAGNLARNSAMDTNAQIAQILGQNYQHGLDEQMTTLGSVLPGMDQFKANMLFSALGANAIPRQIQQSDMTARYQDFLRQLQEPLTNAGMATSILGSAPNYQFMMPQYAPNQWQQALGAIGSVGQAAMPFLV